MTTSFSHLSQDLMHNVVSDLSLTDIRTLFLSSKALRQFDVPALRNQWLKARTDAQLRVVFTDAVDSNSHALIKKLLQPTFTIKIGPALLATTFLASVRMFRVVANSILPFCRCSVLKTSVRILTQSIRAPTALNLRCCRLEVHGERSTPMYFTANIQPSLNGDAGSVDCVQWPLLDNCSVEGLTFWLDAPSSEISDEWAAVTISITLEYHWLNVQCVGVPHV